MAVAPQGEYQEMRELDFDNLSEDDKEWLRAWNREDEIPGEGDDDDDDTPEEGAEGYNTWTKADLKEEIERRNESRADDDHLSVSGNKSDLVGVLEQDDQYNSA